MPRACPSGLSLSLLLMAGLAFAATISPLQIEESLLSRSDFQSASAAAYLWPGCSGHDSLCPPPCTQQSNANNSSTQCLYYLQESHKEEVCGRDLDPKRRRALLQGLRMRHCCEHEVVEALPEAAFKGNNTTCRGYLDNLLEVDDLARRISCDHADLLTRYDCGQNYSIAHHCTDCKEAYRRWVCSFLVPHYSRAGMRVRPCLSVCEDVEQQCPYLLPDQTISPSEAAHPTPQYAGEPAFFCLDPNIPKVGQQRAKSLTGDEDCCYTHCGAPGRGNEGGRWVAAAAKVCEHCPGRPPSESGAPGEATASSSLPVRTFNRVFLQWTTIWTLYQYRQTIYLILIKCLIVCAASVRTLLKTCYLSKTKPRRS